MYLTTESEAPHDHYETIDAKGHTVLDLGSGDFGRLGELPYPSTVEYWYSQGAERVIAVDRDDNDLGKQDADETIKLNIGSPWMLEWLYLKYHPTFVKCDIEGSELHLLRMSPEVFEIPILYAIETHSTSMYNAIYEHLEHNAYTIRTVILLKHTPEQCKVIIAEREDRYDS